MERLDLHGHDARLHGIGSTEWRGGGRLGERLHR